MKDDHFIPELNRNLFAYNQSRPPPMQKGSVSPATIQTAIERWK